MPHLQRGALIAVQPSLKLEDVGFALATDNAKLVQQWMQEKKLVKISSNTCDAYASESGDAFQFLIVQPFVLFQMNTGITH